MVLVRPKPTTRDADFANHLKSLPVDRLVALVKTDASVALFCLKDRELGAINPGNSDAPIAHIAVEHHARQTAIVNQHGTRHTSPPLTETEARGHPVSGMSPFYTRRLRFKCYSFPGFLPQRELGRRRPLVRRPPVCSAPSRCAILEALPPCKD